MVNPRRSLRPRLLSILRLWHLASMDAPTVAVVWAWAFAWSAHVRMAAWPLTLLGLVVWAVYIGDRLLDARAGRELRERHHFHWRHRWVMAPLAAAAAMTAAWIVRRRVPAIALPQDSAVAVATLVYFSGVHGRFKLPGAAGRLARVIGSREFLVGSLFAIGCALPAWSMEPVAAGPASPLRMLALPVVYFSALAWLNVRTITSWESGTVRVARMAWVLAVTGVVMAAGLAAARPRAAMLVAAGAGSALLIGLLDGRSRSARRQVSDSASQQVRESGLRLEPVTLRAAVDLVLLTPLLLLVTAR